MTSVFKEYYLVESAKEYKYRIKLAVNDLSSDQKGALEDALAKFDVRSVGPFKNTPIQQSPLDFPNVRNSQVYTTEVVLGYPVTVDELRVFLSDKVAINQQEIAVYNEYDPRDAYNDEAIAITAGRDEEYVTKLGTEYEADEKPAYGKEYNDKFLKELDDVKKERPVVEVENPLMQATKVDNTSVAPKDVGEAGGYSVMGGPGTDGP
jgi:hypothetical protein